MRGREMFSEAEYLDRAKELRDRAELISNGGMNGGASGGESALCTCRSAGEAGFVCPPNHATASPGAVLTVFPIDSAAALVAASALMNCSS